MYTTYLMGAQRLGLSEDASGYWALHIKEDERHGRQMVHDVALPLADMCVHPPSFCLLLPVPLLWPPIASTVMIDFRMW